MFGANIHGLLDGEMVVLQLCCWKFSHKETLLQTLLSPHADRLFVCVFKKIFLSAGFLVMDISGVG